jgi:hypothetical protein
MTSQGRREVIEAIRRSGTVLEQARQEQRKIHSTLEQSREIDRRRQRSLLRRITRRFG